jgi:hypothetical protein
MRSASLFVLLATTLACALCAAPAQAAQRDRVFVASYGSDSNPCTFGSPCKTFGIALNAVAAGGEITAIDSAGFGPVDIEKAVTITSPNGVEAGIAAAAGGTAITVAAGPNDTVVLSGLTLEGAASAQTGIGFLGGAKLEVVNCTIRNYTSTGMFVQSSAPATVLVSNTVISDISEGTGILLVPESGGNIQAALDGVVLNNSSTGLQINATNGTVEALVANSHLDNNGFSGVYTAGSSGSSTGNVILKNVTLNQEPYGVFLNQYSNVWLSLVTQSAAPGFTSYGGVEFALGDSGNTAYSDGTNHLMTGYANGTPTAWAAQ